MKQSLKSSRMFKYVASASRQHRLFKQFENKKGKFLSLLQFLITFTYCRVTRHEKWYV